MSSDVVVMASLPTLILACKNVFKANKSKTFTLEQRSITLKWFL